MHSYTRSASAAVTGLHPRADEQSASHWHPTRTITVRQIQSKSNVRLLKRWQNAPNTIAQKYCSAIKFAAVLSYKGKGSQSECSSYRPISVVCIGKSICTYPFGAHSASTWQVPQTSTVWFYCRAVYHGCHISLEIVGRVTPKFYNLTWLILILSQHLIQLTG